MSKMPAVSDNKTMTFDKTTKTFTVKRQNSSEWAGIYLWLNNLDISGYNIARVKYKVTGDYGFHFETDYGDKTLEWYEKNTYCPSYLNEMVIPLKSNQKKLNGIIISGTWSVPYEQFVIESVTFENVDNPKLTDIYASNEPPVIDKATSGKFDDKISAWDYVKNLGVGFQYEPFMGHAPQVDFGMDCYHQGFGFKKPSKEIVHFIKETGFKTLRLQTAPECHLLDENYTIDPRFIKAIKEVVDWAIEEDMYVIICGPMFEYFENNEMYKKRVKEDVHFEGLSVSENYKSTTQKLLKAIWKQYAEAFNNSYDEHLIFETTNEPVDCFHDHDHAWNPRTDCAVCKKDYAIMNEYNQIIVDTIRSTGGNNAKRFIMVEGITGKWEYITTSLFKMPKDKANDRLIPTAHNYPMGFTMDPNFGGSRYYTSGVKKQVEEMFETFDKVYFSKHIPVYISETDGGAVGISVLERINCMKDFMAGAVKDNRSLAITLHNCDDYYNNCREFDAWALKWNEKPEYFKTVFYGAQGKEYPLSADFIKKNEVKIESIVGKNLLKEPVEKKNWGMAYKVSSEVFYHSTPAKYKIEFEIERIGNNSELDFAYMDCAEVWHDSQNTPLLKKMRIKGGVLQGNIKVQSKKLVLTIDEDLAREIAENSTAVYLNGQNIIIKSMKVIE